PQLVMRRTMVGVLHGYLIPQMRFRRQEQPFRKRDQPASSRRLFNWIQGRMSSRGGIRRVTATASSYGHQERLSHTWRRSLEATGCLWPRLAWRHLPLTWTQVSSTFGANVVL